MIGSAVFFALMHITRKQLLKDSGVMDVMTATAPVELVLALFFLPFVDFQYTTSMVYVFISSLTAIAGAYTLNYTFKKCEISTAAPLLNLSPVFVLAISYYMLSEVVNILQFFGIVLIMAGGYMITLKDFRAYLHPFTSMKPKFFLLIGFTLVVWSFGAVFHKVALADMTAVSAFFFFSIFSSTIRLIPLYKNYKVSIEIIKNQWLLVVLSGIFYVSSNYLHMLALAVPGVLVSLAMPVKRISTLFTVIFGGRFFKEQNLLAKSIACVIMIAGLFVIGLS